MKRTLLAAILATAAIAFSCSMEEPAQDNSVVMNPTATIANFVFDGPATKTTASFENNVASFAFAASDVLRAYPLPDGDGYRFTVKNTKGTACVFEGDGFALEAGTAYAAYYPGDSETVPEVTAIPVDFSAQSQPAASEWNLSDVDFLFATGIEPANGACEFTMKHLGALLIMNVTFEKAGVFKALELSSDAEFPVQGTVDLTAENVALTATSTANKITLALGGDNGMAVAASDVVTFYMMVPPVDMSNAHLTLNLLDADGKVVLTKQGSGINFEAGKAVAFGATPAAPAVNLSAVETANTYIVSEAGNYYFDASVAGNGAGGAISGASGAWYPAAGTYALTKTGASIKTHFNTNSCVSELAYNATSKTISFKASGAEGVAKISLMDADGDGIWTWLIWCTDQPGTVTYTNPTNNNTYTVMDRNIGATMAASSEMQSVDDIPKLCGLYYSWGRPVPLSPDYESNAFGSRAYTWGPDLEQTFKDPDRFSRNGENVFFNYWVLDNAKGAVGKLWGDAQNFGGGTTTVTKTIYDPCPAGYKVVPANFMEGYDDCLVQEGESWVPRADFYADPFGVYIKGTNGDVYFPYAGRCFDNGMKDKGDGNARFTGLNGGDPDCDGTGFWIWTSGHVNSNTCWIAHLAYNNDARARYGNGKMQNGAPAYACSVRCVAE